MSATKIYQMNTGVVDFKTIASLYSKTFDAIVAKTEKVPREGAEFFATRTTNLETYKEGEVWPTLEVPSKNEHTDRIPMLAPLEGYNQTFTNYVRRSGFIVSKSAVSSQKTRAISQLLTGLPASAQRIEEMAYADVFNKGFATNSGADGSYVFATDHYHEDPAFGTWSNAASSGATFNTDTYFAAWLNMAQRTDPKGNPAPMNPSVVYYPVAMHEAVAKVRNSDKYPQNSLNAKMDKLFSAFAAKPGYWLTSDTQWFVHADVPESDKGLIIVWETKPNYAPLSDSMNPDLILGKRLEMSFSVGAICARDWYANVGS